MELRAQQLAVSGTFSSGQATGPILSSFSGSPGAWAEFQTHRNPILSLRMDPVPWTGLGWPPTAALAAGTPAVSVPSLLALSFSGVEDSGEVFQVCFNPRLVLF